MMGFPLRKWKILFHEELNFRIKSKWVKNAEPIETITWSFLTLLHLIFLYLDLVLVALTNLH